MVTKISAEMTTGLVAHTQTAPAAQTSSGNFSTPNGKLVQLDTNGQIDAGYLPTAVVNQFRLTSDLAITASDQTLTAWEIPDTENQGNTSGSAGALTHSSGLFTFPSTGFYLVTATAFVERDSSNVDLITLKVESTNDASAGSPTFSSVVESVVGVTGKVPKEVCSATVLINVTNVTNDKFRVVGVADATGTSFAGSTTVNKTYLTVLKIAGT